MTDYMTLVIGLDIAEILGHNRGRGLIYVSFHFSTGKKFESHWFKLTKSLELSAFINKSLLSSPLLNQKIKKIFLLMIMWDTISV